MRARGRGRATGGAGRTALVCAAAGRARSRLLRRRGVAGTLCALLGSLALAACGSSSTSTTATTHTDTAFITQANAACSTAYAKERQLRPPNDGHETAKEVEGNVPKLAEIAQAMLGQLTALTPPAAEQQEYDKMLAAWRGEIAGALERAQAAKKGGEKTLSEDRTKLLKLAEEFDTDATKLGLSVCAGNP